MSEGHVFDKIDDLKEKFTAFFQHRKQIQALGNYELLKEFSRDERRIMATIRYCMNGNFLEQEDADWISSKLEKLKINFLDWAHKTKALKEKYGLNTPKKIAKKRDIYIQTYFDLDKPINIRIPYEILNVSSKNIPARV